MHFPGTAILERMRQRGIGLFVREILRRPEGVDRHETDNRTRRLSNAIAPDFVTSGNHRRQHAIAFQRIVVVDLMIRSGKTLTDGGTTQAGVAIVGAGAIGIAIAVRLAGRRSVASS